MRGSVVQKPKQTGRWYVVIDLDRDESGARRQKWHSGFATRRAAEKALTAILSARDNGVYVPPERLTMAQYLSERWLPAIEGSIRPTTFDGYARHVRVYVVPRLGRTQLQQLTPDRISAFYRDLTKAGGKVGQPLSASTVCHVHATLHRALQDAVRWGYLVRNPATAAVKPRQRGAASADIATWTATELGAFLQHVRGDRLFAAWQLAASTGLRRGEILGLRWSDVDLDARRLSVRQTVTTAGNRVVMGEPKTSRGRRNVALDRATVEILVAWRADQERERLALGSAWQDAGLVFTREDGSCVHPDTFSFWFDRHVRTSGLRRIRLHDLRHTHASLALQAGVAAKVVSERLGHSTVAFTLDVYSHVIPALEEDAAERVAALVSLQAQA